MTKAVVAKGKSSDKKAPTFTRNPNKVARKSGNIKSVPPRAFIKAYAQHLKRVGKIDIPKYHDIAKLSTSNEVKHEFFYFCFCDGVVVAFVARLSLLRAFVLVGMVFYFYFIFLSNKNKINRNANFLS
jgi:hypothetical protein